MTTADIGPEAAGTSEVVLQLRESLAEERTRYASLMLILALISRQYRTNLQESSDRAAQDSLTGLYNYGESYKRLVKAVEDAEATGSPAAFFVIDVDKFKLYNDRHGHPAGDDFLRYMASILRNSDITGKSEAGRPGGDEFWLIVPNLEAVSSDNHPEERRNTDLTPEQRADAIRAKIVAAVADHGMNQSLFEGAGVSVGYSIWEPGKTADQMYEEADRNMYGNKDYTSKH